VRAPVGPAVSKNGRVAAMRTRHSVRTMRDCVGRRDAASRLPACTTAPARSTVARTSAPRAHIRPSAFVFSTPVEARPCASSTAYCIAVRRRFHSSSSSCGVSWWRIRQRASSRLAAAATYRRPAAADCQPLEMQGHPSLRIHGCQSRNARRSEIMPARRADQFIPYTAWLISSWATDSGRLAPAAGGLGAPGLRPSSWRSRTSSAH